MTRSLARISAWIPLLTGLGLAGALCATPLSPRLLFDPPSLTLPRLSPSGRQLAIVNAQERQQGLAIIDLASLKSKAVARFGTSRVVDLWWKGEDLLLLQLVNDTGLTDYRSFDLRTGKFNPLPYANDGMRTAGAKPNDYYAGQTDWTQLNWVFSDDNDSERYIGNRGWRRSTLAHVLPVEPEDALFTRIVTDHTELVRVNLRSGKPRIVERAPHGVSAWGVTPQGELLAYQIIDRNRSILFFRAKASDPWIQRELRYQDGPELTLLCLHVDGRRLLVRDHPAHGSDRLVVLDPASSTTDDIFHAADVDIDEPLFDPRQTKLIAVRYETDRPRLHYIDAGFRDLMRGVDQSLADFANEITSASNDDRVMIVHSYSDRTPGNYYLLDHTVNKLMPLGGSRTEIEPTTRGSSHYLTFIARDGTTLHGRLLLPLSANAPPALVILVESFGSNPRSRYQFDPLAQLFVSRGYAVARIDHRGTEGFGREFTALGAYEVVKGVPSDLEDAVRWIVSQGWIDSRRIIMAGFGTGGWPVAHALTRAPDLFSGWINWETPMKADDFAPEMFALSYRSRTEANADLGGPVRAREFIEAINPATLLPKIKVPSFHHYLRTKNGSLSRFGDLVASYARRNSSVNTLATRREADSRENEIDALVAIYEQMFAFLEKNFPSRASP